MVTSVVVSPGRARILLASLVIGGGCRDEQPPPPPPEVAVDPGPPTFTRDVAPILYRNCVGCHSAGGPGPFALIEYDDVRDHASQIVEITGKRIMPPWLPVAGHGRFVGERRLADAEIATLAAWVEAGRLAGDPADLPQLPAGVALAEGGWRLGPPDVVLELDQSYTLAAEGADVYRNFVLHVPAAADGWIAAVELQPGDPKVVHHAVMRVDRTGASARRDAADPEVGFSGMDFAGAVMPDGRFVGWTPGRAPDPPQPARAFRLVEGSDVVLQVHLRPSGKPETIRPRIGLHLSPRPATRHALAMELSSTDIDLPPGAKDVVVEDHYEVPTDVYVVSVYPHAHYLGRHLQGWADLPDGTKKWLIEIDDWNFDWQEQYRLAEPLRLPAGSTIRMRYTYDNSADNPRNPSRPPVHVRHGAESTDEMAELILEIEPANPQDLVALDRELMNAWLERQMRFHRRQLEATPDDPGSIAAIAALEARRGRTREAIAGYRRALELAPARVDLRVDLAIVLMGEQDYDEARAALDAALARTDTDARAHLTMGNLLRKQREYAAAIRHLRRSTELAPDDSEAWNNLAITHELHGDVADAEAAIDRALELAPQRTLFLENRARMLAAQGRDADALAAYRDLVDREPDSVPALRGLAMVLLRDQTGQANALRAIDLAERAAKLTGGRDPTVLEILAIAYASAGKRDRALATSARALEIAKTGPDAGLVERLQTQLDELRAGG